MEYLLQINYKVTVNENEVETSKLSDAFDNISNELESLLPEEKHCCGVDATRIISSLIKIEIGKNCLQCDICGNYVSTPNSGPLSIFPEGILLGKKIVCKQCAWEQRKI